MSFDYPRNVNFQCLKCATCCGDTKQKVRHILLLHTEAEKIAEATGKPIEEFAMGIEHHAPYVYEMRKTVAEGKCIFLQNSRCAIYPLRPLVCRFYPFELKPTKNGKHQFLYTEECHGIGRGEKLARDYFRNLFQQLPVC